MKSETVKVFCFNKYYNGVSPSADDGEYKLYQLKCCYKFTVHSCGTKYFLYQNHVYLSPNVHTHAGHMSGYAHWLQTLSLFSRNVPTKTNY